ncbi:MAG TPA: tRNA lysidine(34) synthetase TilS [Clostridiales bacterium]|nr:MAG: tRNA lysidine(34) synthetase TilS [Clostridiales bacterium GWD2_32_19]HCC08272.1 tRNA lysidine(34) synthetase TilS [Clostridiales bacterium]
MIKKVMSTIQEYDMINKGEKLVVGVSGGADSMSLLHVLSALKNKYNIEVIVVHVNHGIRGQEADRDEKFVKVYCENNNIVNYIFKCNVKECARNEHITEEEAGRKLRYEKFAEVLSVENADKIAVAHNKNDSVETVFINLIRGTGLKGLVGINAKHNNIIRPLICCSRDEIESYCEKNKLEYIIDSTNIKNIYTRNKVRNQLIPYVKENINENVVDNIFRMTNILDGEEEYMEKEAYKIYKNIVKNSRKDCIEMDIEILKKCENAIIRRVIRKALYELLGGNLKDIHIGHVHDIINIMSKQSGKQLNLPNNIIAEKNFNILKLFIANFDEIFGYEYKINKIPCNINVEGAILNLELIESNENIINTDNIKYFDYDKINIDLLSIRNRREGDYIYIRQESERQKLKKFFTNSKIPIEARNKLPILVQNNNTIWIVGYKTSPFFAVNENTKKVLKVEHTIGKEE